MAEQDMVFDDAMASRVLAFQRAHDLKPDGVAGVRSWLKLGEAVAVTAKVEEITAKAAVSVPTSAAVETTIDEDEYEEYEEVALSKEEFPLLFALSQIGEDRAAYREFLMAETGFDIDATVRDIDEIVGA